MGLFQSKQCSSTIPQTLTNLQLTIETLKYENISLKRDLDVKTRETRTLQNLIKKLNKTPSPVNLDGVAPPTGSAPPDTIDGLREQLRLMEDALQSQTADMELMKHNLHDVSIILR